MILLHYIPSLDESSGGVGAYMQLLARDLGKLCELHIVTHKSDNERKLENCTIHYIPYKWLPWNNCKKEFIQLLEDIQPDIFHSNSCWMPVSALTAIWVSEYRRCKSLNIKIVYTPHGMLEPWALQRNPLKKKVAISLFQKKGLQVSDLIHATAESERKNLIALGWNKNVVSIANCVQIDEIQMKTSWERKKNILFLSRVHVKKGINFLIEAVAQLKEELEGYTVTIAGPGEESYVQELKILATKNDVAEMFDFIGPVYGNDKWPLYRKADLFVLPTWSENFGIVVPEALASGTPVITTVGTPWSELNGRNEGTSYDDEDENIANHESLIANREQHSTSHATQSQCGWWTEIGTEPTVKAMKEFLACSEDELEQMGRNGRKLVEEKYTSEAVARQFIETYNSLV